MRVPVIAAGLACLMVLAAFAGCTSSTAIPSYSVDNNGVLSVTCAPVTTNEMVLFSNETYTESKIVLHTQTGDVVTYLDTPAHPKAVMLYLPGAGETISGHADRMVTYARAGYAFMFLDYRGRGGETAGYPLNPQTDYTLFENKEWPEYYLTICDISSAQAMLTARFGSRSSRSGEATAGGMQPLQRALTGTLPGMWGSPPQTGDQGRGGRAGRDRGCPAVCNILGAKYPTCRQSPRARSGCSITRPTRLSRLPKEKPSLPPRTSPRPSPSLTGVTGSIRMSMPGS